MPKIAKIKFRKNQDKIYKNYILYIFLGVFKKRYTGCINF